jgi:CheY-like chemotaxis protein
VVEDDRDVRAYLVKLLRDLNYRVLSAHAWWLHPGYALKVAALKRVARIERSEIRGC